MSNPSDHPTALDPPGDDELRTVRERPGAASLERPGQLGRYRVLDTLGAGGMGEVLRVEDADLARTVAAKVVRGTADGETLARFVQEARVTGQLQHPNIIAVHELAEAPDGRAFFTMQEVRGRTLEALLTQRRPPPLAERLEIFLKVCDAIDYAHSQGVIHRDLKPANVMVGEFGEVQVMDWGLARVTGAGGDPSHDSAAPNVELDGQPLQTQAGAILGTPAYMPPEQAEGGAVGRRSDVYSLGAILYQLLTGELPFGTKGPIFEQLAAVLADPLIPPSERAPERKPPWELDAVVLRAMERQPADRYPSVRHLREDVARWLRGLTVGAADYSPMQRALKFVRRNAVVCAATAAVVIAVFGAGAWAVVGIERERQQALKAAREALASEKKARASETKARDSEQKARVSEQRALGAEATAKRAAADLRAAMASLKDAEAAERRKATLGQFERRIAGARACFYAKELDPKVTVRELTRTLRELEAVIAQPGYADDAQAHALLGIGWTYAYDDLTAERHLLRAHELAPDDAWVNVHLGYLYAERSLLSLGGGGTGEEALARFERSARKALVHLDRELVGLSDMYSHLAGVLRAMIKGDQQAVVRSCEDGLQRYGGQMGAEGYHFAKAYATLSREEFKRFARFRGRRDAPPDVAKLGLRMMTAQQAGWTKALELRPHDAKALASRAIVNLILAQQMPAMMREGLRKQARADLDAALEIAPRLRWALLTRVGLLTAERDYKAALRDLDAAIEAHADWNAHWRRAIVRWTIKDVEGANQDCVRALELLPEGEAQMRSSIERLRRQTE